MSKTFYISTPIYYASGDPHIGHAYSTILADSLSRFKKLLGYDVFFLTGTDEHGTKIKEKAGLRNLTPKEYTDLYSDKFKVLWKELDINYTKFVRTTDSYHKKTVQKIVSLFFEKKFIYKGKWDSWYCVSCEENYTDSDTIQKDGSHFCKIGHKLERYSEDSYFLKLSEFNDWVINFLKKDENWLFPSHRISELVNNFLKDEKLLDLSISRTSFDWGIKFKEDSHHIVYVWIDALFSYLSPLGFLQKNESLYQKYWNNSKGERVHLLSKEITRFHCIYWPIMLKMLNLKQPSKIVSHGWILGSNGNKMSKSLGNVIDPFAIKDQYGSDALRYTLLKGVSLKEDSIFDQAKFVQIYNSDLANNYGNLVSRVVGMINSYNSGNIPAFNKFATKEDLIVKKALNELKKEIKTEIQNLNINNILEAIVKFENVLNLYVEEVKPWVLKKENQFDKLNNFLAIIYNSVKVLVFLLSPVLVKTTKMSSDILQIKKEHFNFDNIFDFALPNKKKIKASAVLFKRIEIEN